MSRLTLEDVFKAPSERIIDTVRPVPRETRIPWWTLVPVGLLVVLAVIRGQLSAEIWATLEWICLGLGALGAALLASRLEERLFEALRDTNAFARLLVCAVIVIAGFLFSSFFVGNLRHIVGEAMRLAALLLFFVLWLSSAAFGSAVIVLIDGLLRAMVKDLRLRIVFAVLFLLTLSFALSGYVGVREISLLTEARSAKPLAALPGIFGISLEDLPFVRTLLNEPHWFGLGSFVAVAVLTFPAVLSVCSKLAESVTERITPLLTAFDRVATGDRSVHLEEAGNQQFLSLAMSFNEMVDKLYLAERIEHAFGQYVSNQVLDRIRAQRGGVQLPAELRTASVFFADIRGFTAISEKLPPPIVVDLLNRYLDQVVPVVDKFEGFLNKFVGDAVVVVFNGPIDQPDHAGRAAACAIALQQLVVELSAQGYFAEVGQLEIGIGVATGPMLCGNIGTKSRMEYTVIGDTVNLASRMTGHARGGEVWVSEPTAQQLPATIVATPFEALKFKGKDRSVVPYCVWPPITHGLTDKRGRS